MCNSINSTLFLRVDTGDDGLISYNWRVDSSSKGRKSSAVLNDEEKTTLEEAKNNLRIHFPSHETVAHSKGGINVRNSSSEIKSIDM